MLHPGLYLGVYGSWYCVNQAKLEFHFSAFPLLYRARSELATRETCAKFGKRHQAAAGDITFGRRVQGPVSLQLLPSWSLIWMASLVAGRGGVGWGGREEGAGVSAGHPQAVKDRCRFLFVLRDSGVSLWVPIHSSCPPLSTSFSFQPALADPGLPLITRATASCRFLHHFPCFVVLVCDFFSDLQPSSSRCYLPGFSHKGGRTDHCNKAF